MDNKNSFKEFLNNPYTKKYLEYSESVFSNAVTTISAACGELESKERRLKPNELAEIIQCIYNQCLGLMRVSGFNTTLCRIAENSDEGIIDIKHFLDFFVKNCNSVIEQICIADICIEDRVMVKIQPDVVKYAMLEFIRRYALKYGRYTRFIISCMNDENAVSISVKVNPQQTEDEYISKSGINLFENNVDNINELLSEKSGVKYYYQKDSMKITIPLYTGIYDIGFFGDNIFGKDNRFSEYASMLADIKNLEDFS